MGIEELKDHIWDLRENYHKTVQDLIQKAVAEGNITEEEAADIDY